MVTTNLRKVCNYSGFILLLFYVMVLIFNIFYVVESKATYYSLEVILIIITLLLLYGLYIGNRSVSNAVALSLLPIPLMFYFIRPIFWIPSVGIIIMYFIYILKKRMMIGLSFLLITYLFLATIIGFLVMVLNVFSLAVINPQISTIDKIVSPNQNYRAIVQEGDEGILGGSVSVYVEKNVAHKSFLGITRKTNEDSILVNRLYYGNWGERPSVKWIDNENIQINGRRMNIFTSKEWNDKD